MYLKALEIQGFKSFPDKTRLTFEKDISAIVGPNGSGKSNIADSILWVMGEQRTKALRGGKMEDVIFGGTEKRPRMGYAQVSLILDNSKRIFDTDSTEIMITRRYYRSGDSEYYINRESVRLKDIIELLMDTGMGRYGYSIIGQGKIADVVSAKSGDRRELFEEAAGISKYRYRKDESERKLGHTDDNLLRINDKIDELKMQVEPLKKQSETAKKYLILSEELKGLEVSVWLETLDKLQDKAKVTLEDFEAVSKELNDAKEELENLYKNSENISFKIKDLEEELEAKREEVSTKEAELAEIESEIAVLNNSKSHEEQRKAQIQLEDNQQESRAQSLEAQIEIKKQRIVEIEATVLNIEEELSKALEKLKNHAEDEEGAKAKLGVLYKEISDKKARLSEARTIITMLSESALEQKAQEEKWQAEKETAENREDELKILRKQQKEELEQALEKLYEAQNMVEGHKLKNANKQRQLNDLGEKKTSLTIEFNSISSKKNMLADMEKDFEGYSKAVKIVMREKQRKTISGIHGPIANLLKTDNRYTLAIETALGGSMQSIVVDTLESGKSAIEMLKRTQGGRATFLPISTIKPWDLKRKPEGEEGYLGTAFELSSFDPQYANIFSNLLSRTIITETLSDAMKITKKYDSSFKIVSLDGQLINAGGSMTGGSSAKNAGILSRANELKSLVEKEKELKEKLLEVEKSFVDAQRELSSGKYAEEAAQNELETFAEIARKKEQDVEQTKFLLKEIDRSLEAMEEREISDKKRHEEALIKGRGAKEAVEALEDELQALENALVEQNLMGEENDQKTKSLRNEISEISENRSSLLAEKTSTKGSIEELLGVFRDISADSQTRKNLVEEIKLKLENIEEATTKSKEKLEIARGEAVILREDLKTFATSKQGLDESRVQNDKNAQNKNAEIVDLQRKCANVEQKKLSIEMEEKQIIDKLWDSYELTRTYAQSLRSDIENLQAANKKISWLRREISALGTPNLGAIDEYERVNERYTFLIEQRDDIEKAKSELLKIIGDITKEMKEIFRREFNIISESFRETFLELFGGGRASLTLEDEEDILSCGIEIKVQPPGKALSNLSLLSGGEKSFVAIALYFAIMKIRPAPFCVMDEIEAALDEANVERYARYMRKLSHKSQFIVITHRRGTMEEADLLYGVTMQEKGVSQVISVDLEEAEKAISK